MTGIGTPAEAPASNRLDEMTASEATRRFSSGFSISTAS
jgi:hypothetical protein